MFYIMLLLWIGGQKISHKLSSFVVVIVLITHVFTIIEYRRTLVSLNQLTTSVEEISNHIPDNAIIYPIDVSGNWLAGHFSNYLGANKPMVILENYEASTGYFPLKWNIDRTQDWFSYAPDENTFFNRNMDSPLQADYLFILGNADQVNSSEWAAYIGKLKSNGMKHWQNNWTFLIQLPKL